jgi:hypothetical protein
MTRGRLAAVTTWIRRNAVALVAVAVLAPATAAAAGYEDWHDYRQQQPTADAATGNGGAVEYAGATWRLVSAHRVTALPTETDDHPVPLPDDVDVIVVNVAITALPNSESERAARALCVFELADETGRWWGPAALSSLPGDRHWPSTASRAPGCERDGQLFDAFVVPRGAARQGSVRIRLHPGNFDKYVQLPFTA